MKTIRICHASTPPGEHNPTTLIIADDLPQFEGLPANREFFQVQAELIVDALEGSLPGGVKDRVMAEMVRRWSKERLLHIL